MGYFPRLGNIPLLHVWAASSQRLPGFHDSRAHGGQAQVFNCNSFLKRGLESYSSGHERVGATGRRAHQCGRRPQTVISGLSSDFRARLTLAEVNGPERLVAACRRCGLVLLAGQGARAAASLVQGRVSGLSCTLGHGPYS